MSDYKQLDHHGQRTARDGARAWTVNAAGRLQVTPAAITATIKRGWLPNEIDAAQSAAELLGPPPARDVFGLRVVK